MTRSKRTPPVDVWSNHACQVAFFPPSALLDLVSVNTRSSPASSKCTPRQPEEHVNQQAASLAKVCPDGLAVTGFWARNAPYLPRQGQSPSCWTFMVTEGHTSREFRDTVRRTCRTTQKSKGKGKRSKQRRIAKRT